MYGGLLVFCRILKGHRFVNWLLYDSGASLYDQQQKSPIISGLDDGHQLEFLVHANCPE